MASVLFKAAHAENVKAGGGGVAVQPQLFGPILVLRDPMAFQGRITVLRGPPNQRTFYSQAL